MIIELVGGPLCGAVLIDPFGEIPDGVVLFVVVSRPGGGVYCSNGPIDKTCRREVLDYTRDPIVIHELPYPTRTVWFNP